MLRLGSLLCCLLCWYLIGHVRGHGYLADPPARSSAWLFDKAFDQCCRYYNHAQMFCGGTYHQWTVNGGKCSICGEAYDLKDKLFDLGGKMYLGKIVRTYTQGATIPVTVVLTANHLGVFEFRVCNIDNDPNQDATQACLNLNLLNVTIETSPTGVDRESTQYPVSRTSATVRLNVTLPSNLVCKHCVFQWKYRTGNSWGSFNGKACLGCGRENEEFFGCSDIAIRSANESAQTETTEAVIESSNITAPTSAPVAETTAVSEVSLRKCRSTATFSETFDLSSIMNKYCETVCSENCSSDKILGNSVLYEACVATCAPTSDVNKRLNKTEVSSSDKTILLFEAETYKHRLPLPATLRAIRNIPFVRMSYMIGAVT
ncbi:unnamed protein product [Adineta ricciae]|uniref:Chitin-binding type-4 domain-containing protein n=1 Tax=Adineta ricciae TaxID=249248 RepID=A0A815LWP4_ADIRI|nr:unnamed protein product [Adineta ricciae]